MTDRLITDVGGLKAGPVPRAETRQLFWEKQLIATFNLLWTGDKQVLNLDEFRRAVEEMSAEEYARTGFYPRRLEGVVRLLIEKGLISAEELDKRTDAILQQGTRDHVGAQ